MVPHEKSTSEKSVALITGASSGIGLALARLFARHGHDLILVSRDATSLVQIAAELQSRVRVISYALDLTIPESCFSLKKQLSDENLVPDILINNAGAGVFGTFLNTPWDQEESMLALNIQALTRLCKLFVPDMIARGSGKILNVASTAAFLPGPRMACYFASKAYVLSFSQALYQELCGTGVTVSTLCPGPTLTAFQKRAGADHLGSGSARHVMTPDAVAECAYRGLMRQQRVIIPGWRNRFFVALIKFIPMNLLLRLTDYLQKQRQTL